MVSTGFTDEDVFRHLSHRPQYIVDGPISIDETAKVHWTPMLRQSGSSPGQLGLPLEILHWICGYLDLQSLSRLSRISLHAKSAVESFPVYRNLTKVAGHTFEILGQTRVVSCHSVSTLCAAFHSNRCISCGAYGPFLLLISAERCCFPCLVVNQSLWMTSLPLARKCFGLTTRQSKSLPIMRSVPGKYCVPHHISRQKPIWLTSVRAAKELALKVHGSLEALTRSCPLDPCKLQEFQIEILNWYRQAPLHPLSSDPVGMNDVENRPRDRFGGMGSVPFPSSIGGALEQGLWCRGCELTYENYATEGIDSETLSRLVPRDCHADQYLLRLQYRAWSRAELRQHAKHCHSADAIISQSRRDPT